ncbi:MAG: GHKL domain-containing protein, partial [candidate division Zixibacteria bacterium]|nr:GHKL domain-containing protein [candidate division Zixibacteria bacterium]
DLVKLLDTTAELREALRNRPELQDSFEQLDTAYDEADISYLRDEIPRAIDQTMHGVERVASIVRAMKDFSHPDKGEKSPEDINRAIASTLTVARNELKYVADLETELQDNLPSVWCYISDLNQVFLNLLVNAAHAIADRIGKEPSEKGRITVRTRGDDERVVIEISDTGNGIPPELRDRIFDPFFTTKPVGRGTGQGLAISRSVIVDKHGGALTFDTETGVGSTFRITLPIGEPKSSSGKREELETK